MFFKQKTAYEMRISDWSSDGCSSDLGRLVVERRHRASFERGQRFVNIDDRRARHDPLVRDAPVAFAQPRENRVLDAVERREVDMPALGRLDAILTAVAPDMRDAEAGARTDDGDRPGFGKRLVGAGQPLEIARVRLRDRMAHRLEIIDQYVAVDAELRSEEHPSEIP